MKTESLQHDSQNQGLGIKDSSTTTMMPQYQNFGAGYGSIDLRSSDTTQYGKSCKYRARHDMDTEIN